MSEDFLQDIFTAVTANPSEEIKVNLENQEIEITGTGEKESFKIDPYKKTCLINGYDDIDFLVSKLDAIKNYEKEKSSSEKLEKTV